METAKRRTFNYEQDHAISHEDLIKFEKEIQFSLAEALHAHGKTDRII